MNTNVHSLISREFNSGFLMIWKYIFIYILRRILTPPTIDIQWSCVCEVEEYQCPLINREENNYCTHFPDNSDFIDVKSNLRKKIS